MHFAGDRSDFRHVPNGTRRRDKAAANHRAPPSALPSSSESSACVSSTMCERNATTFAASCVPEVSTRNAASAPTAASQSQAFHARGTAVGAQIRRKVSPCPVWTPSAGWL
jgi:hypothetical protein